MRCSGENGSYKQEWKGQQERRAGVEVKGGYEWLKKKQEYEMNYLGNSNENHFSHRP